MSAVLALIGLLGIILGIAISVAAPSIMQEIEGTLVIGFSFVLIGIVEMTWDNRKGFSNLERRLTAFNGQPKENTEVHPSN